MINRNEIRWRDLNMMACVKTMIILLCAAAPAMAAGSGTTAGAFGRPLAREESSADLSAAKATYSDHGDFYYLGTGEKASFLRRDDTFALLTDGERISAESLSDNLAAGLGNDVEIVKEHSLTGMVLVKIVDRDRTGDVVKALADSDPGVTGISPVFRNTAGPGDIAVLPEIVVRVADGAALETAVADLERQGLSYLRTLSFTEREHLFRMKSPAVEAGDIFAATRTAAESASVEWAEPNLVVAPLKESTPNDTYFGSMWHLNNTGQDTIVSDADIDAPEGWDITMGAGTVIAVFDDGVQTNHPDLSIWSNPGEVVNGSDDDLNGFIDDINGWDFGNGNNDPNPNAAGDNHGTAVAGVAAAVGDNALGVCGSAYSAEVLPVQSGSMTCSDWGNAMRYACKYADVVNNSWHIGGCESNLNAAISDCVNGAIPGARRGSLGTPVLFATGNAASGWMKFALSGFPAGTYTFTWRYLKDGSVSQGYDTVWLDRITWPGGARTDFEGDTIGSVPAGFTSAAPSWTVVSDGTHAFDGSGRSVRAGDVTDGQTTDLVTTRTVGAGTLYYWAWVSSENDFDYFEFYVDGNLYHWYTPGQYSVHQNSVVYPASNPDTIAVGASTDGDCAAGGQAEMRSYYSQFGPEVDVVAPSGGGCKDIYTTDRTGADGYNDGTETLVTSDYTRFFSGTSSAAPLAAGVVANLLAHAPDLTAGEVRKVLRDGADRIGQYDYLVGRNDYYGNGRVNLHTSLMLASPWEDDVIFDFSSGVGIWAMYNNDPEDWSPVSGLGSELMAVGKFDETGLDDLLIDFGATYGLWAWYDNSPAGWSPVSGLSPEIIAVGDIDNSGQDDAILDFGSGYGVWAWHDNDHGTWAPVTGLTPELMAIADLDLSSQDDVIFDFGATHGVWVWYDNDHSRWAPVTSLSPEAMAVGDLDGDGQSEVVFSFGAGKGVWAWYNNDPASWASLIQATPEAMVIGDTDGSGADDVVFDFGADGVWIFYDNNQASWERVSALDPELITVGDLDQSGESDLIIDFGSTDGVWALYNNNSATWAPLSSLSPEGMACGNVDGL